VEFKDLVSKKDGNRDRTGDLATDEGIIADDPGQAGTSPAPDNEEWRCRRTPPIEA
jgi:hypothetical protein